MQSILGGRYAEMMRRTTVSLSDATYTELDQLAKARRTTVGEVIRTACDGLVGDDQIGQRLRRRIPDGDPRGGPRPGAGRKPGTGSGTSSS